jgi:hypothetical protein
MRVILTMNATTPKPASAPVTVEKSICLNKGMTPNETEAKPEILSCKFIPELPFPWNGAYLEWCRELAGEPR